MITEVWECEYVAYRTTLKITTQMARQGEKHVRELQINTFSNNRIYRNKMILNSNLDNKMIRGLILLYFYYPILSHTKLKYILHI